MWINFTPLAASRSKDDVRIEKVVVKDIKLRTFITEGAERNDLAAHVYDISYGSLRPYQDNLVVIDDSIVRGTTLRESIFKILDRLHPKKIVMVSSAPQTPPTCFSFSRLPQNSPRTMKIQAAGMDSSRQSRMFGVHFKPRIMPNR